MNNVRISFDIEWNWREFKQEIILDKPILIILPSEDPELVDFEKFLTFLIYSVLNPDEISFFKDLWFRTRKVNYLLYFRNFEEYILNKVTSVGSVEAFVNNKVNKISIDSENLEFGQAPPFRANGR